MDNLAAYADSDEEAGPPPQVAAPSSTPIAATQPVAPAATAPVENQAQQYVVALQTQIAIPAQPPAQSLPNDGWVEYKTAQGASYYYHIVTRQTTWERPAAFQAQPQPASNQPSTQAAPTATAPRKPVSWEPIPGSEWRRVLMSDGERVFYNPKTKQSAWTLPADAVAAPAPAATTAPVQAAVVNLEVASAAAAAPVAEGVGQKRALESEGTEAVSAKAVRLQSEPTAEQAEQVAKEKDQEAARREQQREDEAARLREAEALKKKQREEEVAREKQREEELQRREAFRSLLREKNVGPLSHWDKELPRLAFDSRFTAIPKMADRRAEFDAFKMTRGEEDRSAKISAVQKVKEARAAFTALLDSKLTSTAGAPTLSELRAKHRDDLAFTGGLEGREMERMYNEKVEALRRGEESARLALHKRFVDFLLERLRPEDADSWRSARRFLSRQDENWDAPFSVISDRRREELYEEYERELRNKRHSLRQRENEARREREAVERDMERRRAELTREEALSALRAAMRERCRSIDLPWAEAVRLLTGDPRFESSALREGEKAEAYNEHQDQLRAHINSEYRAWLAEQNATGSLPLGSQFAATDARADKRFRVLPEVERSLVFDKYMSGLLSEAKEDLLRLLRETRQLHRQIEPGGDLDGVRRLIEKDARYVRMSAVPSQRESTISEYIRTQAPPPPQAGQLRAQIEAQEEELNPTMPRFTVAMVGQSEKELGL